VEGNENEAPKTSDPIPGSPMEEEVEEKEDEDK